MMCGYISLEADVFLARLYEVQAELLQSPVIRDHVPMPMRSHFICKFYMRSYLDNHLSESLHTE